MLSDARREPSFSLAESIFQVSDRHAIVAEVAREKILAARMDLWRKMRLR
jgi:hypothetical protein